MFVTTIILILQVYSVDPCTITTPLANGTIYDTVNISDVAINGTDFTFTLWTNVSSGSPPGERFSVEVYGVNAAFRAEWNESGDFLARAGLDWPRDKYYWEYGNIFAEYAYTRKQCQRFVDTSGTSKCADDVAGDYSFIGIYGWSVEPLVEYYVVDDWLGNRYTSDVVNVQMSTVCYDVTSKGGSCKVGQITVDGSVYDVYKGFRDQKPSILGTASFDQYFSVRKDSRQCGTISLTKHFKEWESMGLPLGKMYEAKILVEAGGGQAYIDYSHATVRTETDVCNPQSDDHYEIPSGGSTPCVLRSCATRRKNSLNPLLPCGPDCYWDMGATSNTTKCINQSTDCTNIALYQKNEANHTCELKPPCSQRQSNESKGNWPCSLTGDAISCYKDVGQADPDKCSYECSNPHAVGDSVTGRCTLTPCADRTPIIHALPGDDVFPPNFVKRDVYVTVTGITFYAPNKCMLKVQITIDGVAQNSSMSTMQCSSTTPVGTAAETPFPADEATLIWNDMASLNASVEVYWSCTSSSPYKATGSVDFTPYEGSDVNQTTNITVRNAIGWSGDGDYADAHMDVVVVRTLQPCAQRHPDTTVSNASDACTSSFDSIVCVPDGTRACYVEGTVDEIEWACGSATESPLCIKDGRNCKEESSEESPEPSSSRRTWVPMVALLWVMLFLYW